MKTIIIAFLLVPGLALGAPVTCKRSPALTGKCSMVKGSLGLTKGMGVTLEAEDGSHIFIAAPPDSNADIATNVMQNWLYWQTKSGSMNARMNGTYEVCPLPAQQNKPGISAFACINNGSRFTMDAGH